MSLATRLGRDYYLFRRSSWPYISGDGFRAMVGSRVEGRSPRFGDGKASVVFCESQYVRDYVGWRKRNSDLPFVLISGNGDTNFGEDDLELLPDSLIHWYGQNILFTHERASPIPIGLENRYYGRGGKIERIEAINRSKPKKAPRIFLSFNTQTNSLERSAALEAVRGHPLEFKVESRIPVEEFQNLMASSLFALSPPGNGFDCHRTWEALYLGTIPIVKKSAWSEHFSGLGVPLLALDSWESLRDLDEDYLRSFYERHSPEFSAESLYLPYWREQLTKSFQLLHKFEGLEPWRARGNSA